VKRAPPSGESPTENRCAPRLDAPLRESRDQGLCPATRSWHRRSVSAVADPRTRPRRVNGSKIAPALRRSDSRPVVVDVNREAPCLGTLDAGHARSTLLANAERRFRTSSRTAFMMSPASPRIHTSSPRVGQNQLDVRCPHRRIERPPAFDRAAREARTAHWRGSRRSLRRPARGVLRSSLRDAASRRESSGRCAPTLRRGGGRRSAISSLAS